MHIQAIYKNFRIIFDLEKEEWVAYLNEEYLEGDEEFKRHVSLNKVKEAIDRFHARTFTPLPIYFFDTLGNIQYADIISFTETQDLFWVRHSSGYKNGHREKMQLNSTKKIYSCENIMNEPKLVELMRLNDEIEKKADELQTIKRDRYHLISQLQHFEVSGRTLVTE